MTLGEQRLCEWQNGMSGGFVTELFRLIARADADNLSRLAAGFPEEANAFQKYKSVRGYWEKLSAEFNGAAPISFSVPDDAEAGI